MATGSSPTLPQAMISRRRRTERSIGPPPALRKTSPLERPDCSRQRISSSRAGVSSGVSRPDRDVFSRRTIVPSGKACCVSLYRRPGEVDVLPAQPAQLARTEPRPDREPNERPQLGAGVERRPRSRPPRER